MDPFYQDRLVRIACLAMRNPLLTRWAVLLDGARYKCCIQSGDGVMNRLDADSKNIIFDKDDEWVTFSSFVILPRRSSWRSS